MKGLLAAVLLLTSVFTWAQESELIQRNWKVGDQFQVNMTESSDMSMLESDGSKESKTSQSSLSYRLEVMAITADSIRIELTYPNEIRQILETDSVFPLLAGIDYPEQVFRVRVAVNSPELVIENLEAINQQIGRTGIEVGLTLGVFDKRLHPKVEEAFYELLNDAEDIDKQTRMRKREWSYLTTPYFESFTEGEIPLEGDDRLTYLRRTRTSEHSDSTVVLKEVSEYDPITYAMPFVAMMYESELLAARNPDAHDSSTLNTKELENITEMYAEMEANGWHITLSKSWKMDDSSWPLAMHQTFDQFIGKDDEEIRVNLSSSTTLTRIVD